MVETIKSSEVIERQVYQNLYDKVIVERLNGEFNKLIVQSCGYHFGEARTKEHEFEDEWDFTALLLLREVLNEILPDPPNAAEVDVANTDHTGTYQMKTAEPHPVIPRLKEIMAELDEDEFNDLCQDLRNTMFAAEHNRETSKQQSLEHKDRSS